MKLFTQILYLFAIVALLLTTCFNIADGNLHKIRQSALDENLVNADKHALSRKKDHHHSVSGLFAQWEQQVMPTCCRYTVSEVEERIDLLKKTLKVMRSCGAKKRVKTCGFRKKTNHRTAVEPVNNFSLVEKEQNLDLPSTLPTSTTTVSTTTIKATTEQTKNDDVIFVGNYVPNDSEKQYASIKEENDKDVLSDDCLFAIEQYLYYYGKGTHQIEKSLGAANLMRLNNINFLKNAREGSNAQMWDIRQILHNLEKCHNAAMTRDENEKADIIDKIIQLIFNQYFGKQILVSEQDNDMI